MTPMRSVYPCRYLHELNSYCTSVQRRIAPSRSPKLIVSSLSKQDQVSDTSITLPSSPSSTKSTTVFPHDFRWNYSQLGAVTPSHRSPSIWTSIRAPCCGRSPLVLFAAAISRSCILYN